MSELTGGCMCGAVRFTATDVPSTAGACHCEMCRRWTGSAMVGVSVRQDNVSWDGEAQIKTLQSSDWAERAWCQRCGSALYYRFTGEGPLAGTIQMPVGLFDDPSGFRLSHELFVDCRAGAVDLLGASDQLTRAEVFAKFGGGA